MGNLLTYLKIMLIRIEASPNTKKCTKETFHGQYIKHRDFRTGRGVFEENIQERFTSSAQHQRLSGNDYATLQECLQEMSHLTGLLIFKERSSTLTSYGTGFIAKIRIQTDRQCPCPLMHRDTITRHAIVTVSTAYHVFRRFDKKNMTYQLANQIWSQCIQVMKLYHDDEDRPIQEILDDEEASKTLYGLRLIDTDKDIDIPNDWCAAEFVTHKEDLIQKLQTSLSTYQSRLASLYEISRRYKDVNLVVIIGHPHGWAKRISVGKIFESPTRQGKEVLKDIRDHQTWCRYCYDAVTCPGSSGSPIFKWGQTISGFGYWFGHPHNHSNGSVDKNGITGCSTIGVENSL